MKRPKNDSPGGRKLRLSHLLLTIAALYLIFISLKFPRFLEIAQMLSGDDGGGGLRVSGDGNDDLDRSNPIVDIHRELGENQNQRYGRITGKIMREISASESDLSVLERIAEEAWTLGGKAWQELESFDSSETNQSGVIEGSTESCPSSISVTGEDLARGNNHPMFLPCGLAAGSSVTVIGTPHKSHVEFLPQLAKFRYGNPKVFVSQFMVELLGLKAVDGEDPPRILHLNPRLKGDWSHRPVIEHNTCYRMQWGAAQRCDGLSSKNEDDVLVDGFRRCEKWMRSGIVDSKESKTTSWFKRFIGREQKPEVTWPFAFVEGRLFVLTVRAGVDGYHINVGGRHMTSFPYRTGFTLEDATGLAIKGDVDVHSVYATSLPTSHPSFSLQRVLEMSEKWKAQPLPQSPVQLFIGILSATNHFAERMAVRKTWMQSDAVKSLNAVARFFVALYSGYGHNYCGSKKMRILYRHLRRGEILVFDEDISINADVKKSLWIGRSVGSGCSNPNATSDLFPAQVHLQCYDL
ncbi:hypothetical protein GIB67_031658 [Kingdonia uniflora]|uniref:Galectin n=1 Tax=Kingdonia uniflora TaxID=39325 RepID=A0A7J7NJU9_9MAGN|nr:hypothetical protein GIB67_031658 [Kingdonia uniflora]